MPGIKIYRYEGSLYYACAEHFRESIYSMTDFNPRKEAIRRKRRRQEKESAARSASNGAAEVEVALQPRCEEAVCDLEPHEEDLHHVIVDCSTWSYIDYVGVKVMSQIIQEYRDIGVHVFLANPKSEFDAAVLAGLHTLIFKPALQLASARCLTDVTSTRKSTKISSTCQCTTLYKRPSTSSD